jgi:uncharacterized protein
VKYIADAGALIALMNEDDQHHGWAVATLPRLARPWLVCEAVLAFDLEGQLVPVVRLLERYADREMDLADACVVRMSELHPRSTVITVDRRDFTAYRRNQREVLPFIAPEV